MSWIFVNREKLSDEDLLLRYRQKGDSESLGILYDRYMHLVYGLCLKYLKSRESSQDAVMDIYQLLAEKLAHQDVKHFKSWLYIVSKNHCLMILRKTNKALHFDQEFMEIPDIAHHNEESRLEDDLTALEHCIEQLNEEQKQCVSEFYLKELSYQEIATKTKLELKKVKSHIQNGKRNLKICLESKNVRE